MDFVSKLKARVYNAFKSYCESVPNYAKKEFHRYSPKLCYDDKVNTIFYGCIKRKL